MTFKVIVTYPSVTDDEHQYWAIVFLTQGNVKSKRLEINVKTHRLEAEIVYDGSPIAVGERFLTILVPGDDGGYRLEPPRHLFGENHPASEPEVVNFPQVGK
jgi:hypothetical protein